MKPRNPFRKHATQLLRRLGQEITPDSIQDAAFRIRQEIPAVNLRLMACAYELTAAADADRLASRLKPPQTRLRPAPPNGGKPA